MEATLDALSEERRQDQAAPIRLNLGAGDVPIEGFTPVDRKLGSEVYPLDGYADNSVDEILASHILEHLPHRQTLDVLREWVRVLKPGGRIRVSVPDMEWCARRILSDDGAYPIEGYMMGGQSDENDYHKALFNARGLKQLMLAAGLRHIRRWESKAADCASLPVSLNLEGRKREPVSIPRTIAVMSTPRVGWTDNFTCAVTTLPKLGIDFRPAFGVFWHQAIDKILTAAVDEGFEYVLTVDYDSVFTIEQPCELIRLMNEHPEADAICGMQMRREMNGALLAMHDADGKYQGRIAAERMEEDLLPVSTAHFGLTLFRVSALKDLPRPWFVEQTDEQGRYGPNRTDADVAFWKHFTASGRKLFVAPHVPVGHLELMVNWPTEELQPRFQRVTEWREQGIPIEVRR